MESEDTAISKRQIGIGAEMWATVHILRNSAEPDFDPVHPPELTPEEVTELTGISRKVQGAMLHKLKQRLSPSMIG